MGTTVLETFQTSALVTVLSCSATRQRGFSLNLSRLIQQQAEIYQKTRIDQSLKAQSDVEEVGRF